MPSDNKNSIPVKMSVIYYGIAFIMIGAVALLAFERIVTEKEFGWLGFLLFTVLLMSPPVLLVPYRIEADRSSFTFFYRFGKKLIVSKRGITRVDQAWDKFSSHGFSSHWSGVINISNGKEINKFIKRQIKNS